MTDTDVDIERGGDAFSRRSVLGIAGVTASSVLLAGCGGGGEDPDDGPIEPGEGERDNVDNPNEAEEGVDEEGADGEIDDWEHVNALAFDAHVDGWRGVEPAVIEGEENPALVLYEGIEYRFDIENVDNAPHNLEFWDENDEIVDGYESELVHDEGESQTMTVEASDEMVRYVCGQHPNDMTGEIEIETDHDRESGAGNQSEGDADNQRENSDNESEDDADNGSQGGY